MESPENLKSPLNSAILQKKQLLAEDIARGLAVVLPHQETEALAQEYLDHITLTGDGESWVRLQELYKKLDQEKPYLREFSLLYHQIKGSTAPDHAHEYIDVVGEDGQNILSSFVGKELADAKDLESL